MSNLIRISEIFGPTIQGEGPVIGTVSMFIRTHGCDFKCSWCDTPYAMSQLTQPPMELTTEQIMARLEAVAPPGTMVTVTGGNPCIQDLTELTRALRTKYVTVLETQGSRCPIWAANFDFVVVSPKPPSSGMPSKRAVLDKFVSMRNFTRVALKFVIFDENDFAFMRELVEYYWEASPMGFYLQVGNHVDQDGLEDMAENLRWLGDKVLADKKLYRRTTILPQLHVWMYGNERGK